MFQAKLDQLPTVGTPIRARAERSGDDDDDKCASGRAKRAATAATRQDVLERGAVRRAIDLTGPTQSAACAVGADPPALADFEVAMRAWAVIGDVLGAGDPRDLASMVDFFARFGALNRGAQQRMMQLLLAALRGGQGARDASEDHLSRRGAAGGHGPGVPGGGRGVGLAGGTQPWGQRPGLNSADPQGNLSEPRTLVARQLDQLLRGVIGDGTHDLAVLSRMARTFLQGSDPLASLPLRFGPLPRAAQQTILNGDERMLRGALQLLLGPSHVRDLGPEALEMLRVQLFEISRGVSRWEASLGPREALHVLLAELAAHNPQLGSRAVLEAFIAPLYGFPPLPLLHRMLAKMRQEDRSKFWKGVTARLHGPAGGQHVTAAIEAAERKSETFLLTASTVAWRETEHEHLYVIGHMLGQTDPIPVGGDQEPAYPSASYLHDDEAGAFEKLALHIRDDLPLSDRSYVLYKIERTPGMSDLGRALTTVVASVAPPVEALGGAHEMAQLNCLAGRLLDAAPSLKHYF